MEASSIALTKDGCVLHSGKHSVAPRRTTETKHATPKVFRRVLSQGLGGAVPLDVESTPITREYEDRLYSHYGRPPYWLLETERQFSHSGV